MQLDDTATVLGTVDFFEICDNEQRRLLAFASERQMYEAGDIVYRNGDIADGAHVLVSGQLLVTPEDDDKAGSFKISEPGALIGAMALILAKPRPLTVTAITQAETVLVPRSAFMKLVRQDPDLAARAAEQIRHDLGAYLGAIAPVQSRMRRD